MSLEIVAAALLPTVGADLLVSRNLLRSSGLWVVGPHVSVEVFHRGLAFSADFANALSAMIFLVLAVERSLG